jgi:2-desacetyl-2-hydroxyethyl bacteriochlorophyllide A dehydrogenase
MRALTFQGPGEVRYETVRDAKIEAPDDAVVELRLGAVCGSDLHVYRGHETGLDLGTVLGHEFLGEIVEIGSGVTGLAVGDRVVSPFSTCCGDCFYCRRGLTARCEKGQLFGWVEGGEGLHGAQAELVRVPLAATTLVRVDEALDEEAALLAGDVLSTGIFCAESGGAGPDGVTVVLGCGPVGLMAIAAAREAGCERVLAVDSVPERLDLARRFGAEALALVGDEIERGVLEATGGRGADTVLEAVGSPAATRLAVDLVRPGGTIAAAGVHTEERFAFAPGEAYDKNLTYVAGRCSARAYMERALGVVASGRYPLTEIVSHRLPLAEGARAYEIFDRKLEGCTKALLLP